MQVAGRFELIDLIAEGASGSVWRAWDLKAQRLCAAKLIKETSVNDALRIAKEKSLRVNHSHLAVPYGWAADDEHSVIASELYTGGTLADLHIRQGNLNEESVHAIVRQLLLAVNALHRADWIHRDIKPSNILLQSSGTDAFRLALTDFGLATKTDQPRLTGMGLVAGTPGYIAPEMFDGATPNPQQDLYAVGKVALYLLAGKEIAEVDHGGAGESGPASELVPVLLGIEPDLGEVIWKLLAENPVERYQSASEALLELPRRKPPNRLATGDGKHISIPSVLPEIDIGSLNLPRVSEDATYAVAVEPASEVALAGEARRSTDHRQKSEDSGENAAGSSVESYGDIPSNAGSRDDNQKNGGSRTQNSGCQDAGSQTFAGNKMAEVADPFREMQLPPPWFIGATTLLAIAGAVIGWILA